MSQSRDEIYLKALKETKSELTQVRSTGNWLVTASFAAAAMLYIGAAFVAFMWMGREAFLLLDPMWFFAVGVLLLGPSIAIILAGFLARQSIRTARANALILRASQMLLLPADAAAHRIDKLATRVREETVKIDELIETAYASLAELRQALGTEREQFSSLVEQNSVNIAEMMQKLTDERLALSELSTAVENQTAAISEAIPRQARTMAEAARMAQQEVAQADLAVDERLKSLDETSRKLTEKLTMLDEMSVAAEKRSDRISDTVMQMEQRLNTSARTVETAIKASEIAATAAVETGNALNAAVSNALDGTREASEFIRAQSREAIQEALKGLQELKAAGEQAEAATRAAGEAARVQADETETRINALSQMLYDTASRATTTAEAGLDRARQRIERASALLNGLNDLDDPSSALFGPAPAKPAPAPQPAPVTPPPAAAPSALRPRQNDDAVAPTPPPAAPVVNTPPTAPTPVTPPKAVAPAPAADVKSETLTDTQEEEDHSLFDIAFDTSAQREVTISWKDLLSGLNAEPEERDHSARIMLSELEDMGVSLQGAFNQKETRRIAGAARKSEKHRRRMVREYAGSKVQEIRYRMEDQPHFHAAVERFITNETTDGIRALTEADRSRTSTSARLSAFLLLDTAYADLKDMDG